MQRVIHKHPLDVTDSQIIELPIGSKIRDIQLQNGTMCVWSEGPIEFEELSKIEVKIVGTGHHFDIEDFTFIKTVQMDTLVWHVYMREV